MKKIKIVTDELEMKACENAGGFDHSKLCYKSIFNLLDDNGIFYNAVNQIVKSEKPRTVKIDLKDINYGVVKENDGKIYPSVSLIVSVKDSESDDFVFMVTPFNATMESVELWDTWSGNVDKELTMIWRTVMKGLFKDLWISAFEKYELESAKNQSSVAGKIDRVNNCEINNTEEDFVETF